MASKCRCDSEPCAGVCPCFKTGNMCTNACHMGKPWESVPCLNTEHGLKVKTIKQVEARLALSAAGLSPVGDRHELLKRLAVHYSKEEEKRKKERVEERQMQRTCKFCYRMFANKNSCDRHVKKIHSEKVDSVEASNLTKKLEEGFKKKCPYCKRYFKYEFSRESHVKRFHHSDNNKEEDEMEENCCDVCNKVFVHKISLKRHMDVHSQEPVLFSCKYCDVKMSRKDNLSKHTERIHLLVDLNFDLIRKQDVFKCKLCCVDFGQDQRKFESHLILKTCQRKEEILEVNERGKLQCEECHRSYADVNSLTRHIAWKHRESVHFECSECKASFKLKSSLTRHKKLEHG